MTLFAWLGILSGLGTAIWTGIGLLTMPRTVMLIAFVSAVVALVTSIGLRARKEWARRGVISLLVYTLVAGWYWALLAHHRIPTVPGGPNAQLPQAQVDQMYARMRPALVMGMLSSTVIYGLILAKLLSRGVRDEFDPDGAA